MLSETWCARSAYRRIVKLSSARKSSCAPPSLFATAAIIPLARSAAPWTSSIGLVLDNPACRPVFATAGGLPSDMLLANYLLGKPRRLGIDEAGFGQRGR